jgi:large subunit ribosomal protein L29
MTTTEELSKLSIDDLAVKANDLRQTLLQDQLKLRTGALDNPSERTGHRRDLARVLTIATQKQIANRKKK